MKKRRRKIMKYFPQVRLTVPALSKRTIIIATVLVFGLTTAIWLAAIRLRAATVAWPLKVSSNGRHLVDSNNKPFLYVADTAWMTVARLSVADAKRYIDIKDGQGFNAIQSSLTPWGRSEGGDKGSPFSGGDMTQPNEAYWTAVDEIIKYAESKQMLVVLWPMWLADNGGWGWKESGSGDPAPSESEFSTYATWLGNRYKTQGNIMWAMGGDEEYSEFPGLMSAGAEALHAADPAHLITYHPRSNAYSIRSENWVAFNSFQWNDNTGDKTYEDIREGYDLSPTKPILDAEPPYIPDPCCGDLKTSPQRNRANGWWAILAGAMGVVYGGERYGTWNIGKDGTKNWETTADESGKHTGNIRRILENFPWDKLTPDWDNQAVTGGRGSYGGTDYVAAGRAEDGSLIVAYTPDGGTLNVDLSKLSGSGTAQWYDPVSGAAAGSAQSVSNSGSNSFSSPGSNAGGDSDWVLVISTAAASTATPEPTTSATPVPTASSTPTGTATPVPTTSATATPNVTQTPQPTATGTPVPTATDGDINRDNKVDLADLEILLIGWTGTPGSNDVNNDGSVNVYDLSVLLSNWSQ